MYPEGLSAVQVEVLNVLVELYEKTKRVVKGREIASAVDRDDGTIRNLMPSLKAMQLIEALPGPRGGYLPTYKTYEYLRIARPTGKVDLVPAYREGQKLGFTVKSIEFLDVSQAKSAKVLVKASGSLSGVEVGHFIRFGPATENRLIVEGRVVERDDLHKNLLLTVSSMISIPDIPVMNLIRKKLFTISPEATVREAAAMLSSEGIRGGPVVEGNKTIGMFTSTDIGRALSEKKEDCKVREVMSEPPVTVGEDINLLEAVKRMQQHNVGRLVVVSKYNKLVGIVTRTDILRRILRLESL